MRRYFTLFILLLTVSVGAIAQTVSGVITDKGDNQPLYGVAVVVKGSTNGASTDFDGKFTLDAKVSPPFTIVLSLLGYGNQEIEITSANIGKPIKVQMAQSVVMMTGVEVVDTRITEKQKESPLTVESMGITAIKETPAANFYEGLGLMKGVDLTSASIGFKIINTRGFNSTSPVRSLQIIDGVDNQSPGLNFSLGNFLGASELDVQKVDLVVGASSAFYGPNAFNGVIAMTTKDPFIHHGLAVSLKGGERDMFEGAIRYARVFKNKKGDEKFAFKVNLFYLRAKDWEANNYTPATDSKAGVNNPGGYDAVNRYGDEALAGGNTYTSIADQKSYPGLGVFYRTGYLEKDLLNYNTQNAKANLALHYKLKPDMELIYSFNYGTGTTVYQGENRYGLNGIQFFQNRLEIKQDNKFFVRFYATNEDAGNSYDAVVTAFQMQNAAKGDKDWNSNYSSFWQSTYASRVRAFTNGTTTIGDLYNNPTPGQPYDTATANAILALYQDSLVKWQAITRQNADQQTAGTQHSRFLPGTAAYDSLFRAVTSKLLSEGGSKFYDKSALYHIHGEYTITPKRFINSIVVGANGRLYVPNSHGSIFSDTATTTIKADTVGGVIKYDTSRVYNHPIYNYEFGVYLGLEKKFWKDKIKVNLTGRVDKNQNFNFLVSPAASVVYSVNKNHTLRLSFSAAIRNPTLSDQYLNYNVGRAILVGNLHGYDSLATIESFVNYISGTKLNPDTLKYFNVDPIKPEKVKTIEIGYRATVFKSLYIDASYYYSFYRDFIGYKLGVKIKTDALGFPTYEQAYRVSANAPDLVTTQGVSVALNYFFLKFLSINGNYTFNVIDLHGSSNPIIPAYNTPTHKFNVGVSGREIEFKKAGKDVAKHWGFSVNYKWVQGFKYEGSPQFSGDVPTYSTLDMQINKAVPKIYCTFKLGVNNLLNNKTYQVYGGPAVGRLAYASIVFDIDKL